MKGAELEHRGELPLVFVLYPLLITGASVACKLVYCTLVNPTDVETGQFHRMKMGDIATENTAENVNFGQEVTSARCNGTIIDSRPEEKINHVLESTNLCAVIFAVKVKG